MWLTKNEKKILKLLVDNAKLSDTAIGKQLGLTSQAVGRIRKKLEEEIIKKYSIELDLEKLGLKSISLMELNYNKEDEEEIKKGIHTCPKMIKVLKHARGCHKYDITKLDSDFEECEKCTLGVCDLLKTTKVTTIPLSNMIKYDMAPLYHQAIDRLGIRKTKASFNRSD